MNRIIVLSVFSLCCLVASAQTEPPSIEQDYDVFLLKTVDELPFSSGQFLVLPSMGLFMTNDIEFVSLDSVQCPNIKKFRLKCPYTCEKLFSAGGKLMMKNNQYLLNVGEDSTSLIAKLDMVDFDVYPISDTAFSILYQDNEGAYVWAVLDAEKNEMSPQLAFKQPIAKVERYGKQFLIATGNDLLLCDETGTYYISHAEEPILDVVASSMGVFLCTASTLYSMSTDCEIVPLANSKYHSLYIDGGTLYVVTTDGSIYVLTRKDS